MWAFLRAAALWAWRERALLTELLAKYCKAPGGGLPEFDGVAVSAALRKYEPVVWQAVSGGLSLSAAILKVMATTLAPHRMTRAEEERWFNRQAEHNP